MYEIYGTENCGICEKAKRFLTRHDKEFVYIDVAENEDITAAFFNKFPGVKTVPQIMLDDDHIGGYNELKNSLTLDEIESIL